MKVLITDFDDTLFPTFHLSKNKLESNSVKNLQDSLKQLFKLFKKYCDKIFIITNSGKGWVESKLKNFGSVEIISTIDRGFNYGDIWNWKKTAFEYVLEPYFLNSENNSLISFGDTDWDRYASISLKNVYSNLTVKNIKFKSQPNFDELLFQHKIVCRDFDKIIEIEDDIDLEIDPKILAEKLSIEPFVI